MKQAVILHGTDGSPDGNWFPWLKRRLQEYGYEVWVPELPGNHTPNRHIYNDFLFGSGWDFTDNLVIGHSSGAVSVLNLLADKRCPHIRMGVLVGAWSHMEETDLDREQFKDLFPPDGFDFATIRSKAPELLFLHGSDDPYCPIEQSRWLADQTDSEIIVIPDGQHLGANYPEFPQLLDALSARDLLGEAYPPIAVVNEQDEPVGATNLFDAYGRGLIHRLARVFVEDGQGNVLLQKRSAHVLAPDRWSDSAAGHVDAEESYENAARREMYEEIGVRADNLEQIAHYLSHDPYSDIVLHRFNAVFRVVLPHDTVFKVNPEEVSEVRWFPIAEARDLAVNHPDQVTDGLAKVLSEYLA